MAMRLLLAFLLMLSPFGLLAQPLADEAVMTALTGPQLLPDHWIGRADAPVTIIEYGPLNCPHCARFWKEQLPSIKSNYIDTGKVRYALRDYPSNPRAMDAAKLARCAGARRLEVIDLLFREAARWTSGGAPDQLVELVVSANIPKADAQRCLADEVLGDTLQRAMVDSYRFQKGASGALPIFFVNGVRYEMTLPPDAIDKALGVSASR